MRWDNPFQRFALAHIGRIRPGTTGKEGDVCSGEAAAHIPLFFLGPEPVRPARNIGRPFPGGQLPTLVRTPVAEA